MDPAVRTPIPGLLPPAKIDWRQYANPEKRLKYTQKLESAFKTSSFYEYVTPQYGYQAPMGHLLGVPGEFGLWMPGVSLIARYKAAKLNVENLYVEKTMDSFASTLRTHLLGKENFRAAFIVPPTFSGCESPNDFPQHKVAVVFERSVEGLKMAILDSHPVGGQTKINPDHLNNNPDDIWEGFEERGNFNAPELIARVCLQACQGLDIPKTIYHSVVVREKTNGSEIFSIDGGLAFLQNLNFFKEIKCDDESIEVPEKKALFKRITVLPPTYMLGTQVQGELEKYRKNEPELFQKQLPFTHKVKSLQSTLDKYSSGEGEQFQNCYILAQEIKYFTWIIENLKKNPERVKELTGFKKINEPEALAS